MAWLDEEDLKNEWVEVVNYDGEFLGWMTRRHARMHKIPLRIIETPPRFKEDQLFLHHAKMLYESGITRNAGANLSEVQRILLATLITNRYREDEILRERAFEEQMVVNNPELYRAYLEQKEKDKVMEMDGELVEERIPADIEEFLSSLGAFDETEDDYIDDAAGWLDGVLTDEEMQEMGE